MRQACARPGRAGPGWTGRGLETPGTEGTSGSPSRTKNSLELCQLILFCVVVCRVVITKYLKVRIQRTFCRALLKPVSYLLFYLALAVPSTLFVWHIPRRAPDDLF